MAKLPPGYAMGDAKLPPGYQVAGSAFSRVATFNGVELAEVGRGMTLEEAISACWRHHNDSPGPKLDEWPEARLGDARDRLAKALGVNPRSFARLEHAVEMVEAELASKLTPTEVFLREGDTVLRVIANLCNMEPLGGPRTDELLDEYAKGPPARRRMLLTVMDLQSWRRWAKTLGVHVPDEVSPGEYRQWVGERLSAEQGNATP